MRAEAIERIRLAEQLPEPLSHYTDVVRAGDTAWVSGMLAFDPGGQIVGVGDVVAQTEQIFHNLALVLDRVGAEFEHIVKVVVYLLDINDRAPINEVRRRHFGEARPASTLVEVSALAHPLALVEIDAVVHTPRA
jgi:2-iminobutanoate/2-iminopropanoate deaminase